LLQLLATLATSYDPNLFMVMKAFPALMLVAAGASAFRVHPTDRASLGMGAVARWRRGLAPPPLPPPPGAAAAGAQRRLLASPLHAKGREIRDRIDDEEDGEGEDPWMMLDRINDEEGAVELEQNARFAPPDKDAPLAPPSDNAQLLVQRARNFCLRQENLPGFRHEAPVPAQLAEEVGGRGGRRGGDRGSLPCVARAAHGSA
jgi:hypothetical protein